MLKMNYFFVFLVVFAGFQVNDAEANTLDKIEEFVKEIFNKMKEEIHELVRLLRNFWMSLIQKGQQHIDGTVATAVAQVQNLEVAHCVHPALTELQAIKITKTRDFFHCDKMNDALAEMGAIVVDSLQLTSTIAQSAIDVMKNLTQSCISINPFKAASCFFKELSSVQNEIKNDLKLVKDYKETVQNLYKSIYDNIQFCLHNDTAVSFVEQVDTAVQKAHTCQLTYLNPLVAK